MTRTIRALVIAHESVHVETIEPTLENYQRVVGGYIEVLRVTPNNGDWIALVHEEAKPRGLRRNQIAERILGEQGDWYKRQTGTGDYISGTVVILGAPDGDLDNPTDLPPVFTNYLDN